MVLDASVTLAYLLADESNLLAESAFAKMRVEAAIVPAHWILEVVSRERHPHRSAAKARYGG